MPESTPIILVRQRHEAKRAGLHYDLRMVVGDKAYSWATKKEMPQPGKPILLFEQPVHDAVYALSQRVEIPDGQYGAGVTTLDFAQKGSVTSKDEEHHVELNNGDRYLIKKMPGKYGDKSWLFLKKKPTIEGSSNPYLEKAASMFERHKYLEKPERISKMISPVGFVKYDGANFFMKYDDYGKPSFISRRRSVSGEIIDRTEKVPHLAKVLPEHAGEVYNVELIHTGSDPLAKESPNRLAGILNSGVAKSLKAQEDLGPIRAVVFDVISPGHTHYGTKYEQIKKLEKSFGDSDLLFAHEGHHGHEAVERLVAKTKAESREGVIAIDFDSPEIKNPRIKVKHRKHWNLRVTAIHEEFDKNGVPKGRAGSLELQDASGKNCGKAGTGFTAEMRKLIWENKSEWMGKLVKIEAMDPTSEKLRSPVYAGDADGHLDYVE